MVSFVIGAAVARLLTPYSFSATTWPCRARSVDMPATRPSATALAMYASSFASRCESKPNDSGLDAGLSTPAAGLAARDAAAGVTGGRGDCAVTYHADVNTTATET